MIEMELNKIRIDERRGEQVIVLKEKDGDRMLPIVIGIMEVTAIKMHISGMTPPRPMTHDLFLTVIRSLGATLERTVIDQLEHSTFYAKLIIKTITDEYEEIDARPSDSVALAVRAKVPIFVTELVLEKIASGLEQL